MAISEFLFNDAPLSEDTHILTALVDGNIVPGTKMLDGDVNTCVPGASRIVCVPRSSTSPTWNAMGLINLPPSPAAILSSRDSLINNDRVMLRSQFSSGGGNYLIPVSLIHNFPLTTGTGFTLTSTLNTLCPALIYLGNLQKVECFYPTGWMPPMIHPVEDDILLSENSLPIGKYITQRPFETEIPFSFVGEPENLNPLIKQMQKDTFLWRWKEDAPLLYCVATGVPQWKYIAPNTLDLRIKIMGYFEYQNLGAEVPGGSFSGVPGGGTIPGTGGSGDFVGRHLAPWGYSVSVRRVFIRARRDICGGHQSSRREAARLCHQHPSERNGGDSGSPRPDSVRVFK